MWITPHVKQVQTVQLSFHYHKSGDWNRIYIFVACIGRKPFFKAYNNCVPVSLINWTILKKGIEEVMEARGGGGRD